jgi:hypothetical protein
MALYASVRCLAPLRSSFGTFGRSAAATARTAAGSSLRPCGAAPLLRPATLSGVVEAARARTAATVALQVQLSKKQSAKVPAQPRTALTKALVPAPAVAQGLALAPQQQDALGGVRTMTNWRLRPYAMAGTAAMVPMSSLGAGFSKVGLSLLVLPWKALPTILAFGPLVWLFPAAYRMIFTNSMRHTTASAFTLLLYLTISFMPVACFENLFSDLSFYVIALSATFFMYTFFPEVLLHDFMFMHYIALFTVPLIPLAFAYMPMFATRSYLFL